MADEIGADIGLRVGERIAHSRLGGEMDDALDRGTRKPTLQCSPVGDIDLQKRESGEGAEPVEACPLQGDRVVRIEIVQADNGVAALQ